MADAAAAAAAPRAVLVLHVTADEPFVRGYLVPALGPTPVVEARDVATLALAELEQALGASRITIAVITPAFLGDPRSRFSELVASDAAIERALAIIPLVLEDCALPLHMKAQVRLDFRSEPGWDREAQRLRDFLARPAPVAPELPCPYPGMRAFGADDARYFHGRDAEIEVVIGLVTAGEREIIVLGPSGSGKSSLIGAGVLPRLAAQPGASELAVRVMRPGEAPARRLAERVGAAPGSVPDAAAVAAWAARHPGARLVVVIDQLEELFTLAPAAERARFAAAVRALRGEPRCLIVLALRADFYAELLDSELWLDGGWRHVDLPALRGPALRAAIERPARALEVYLEPGLVERLLADAAGEPGVLPLLQETLVQLWAQRRHQLVTLAAYEALGEPGRSGLAVTIAARADRCLRDLTPAEAAIARRLLLRLVSFGDGRPDTRRRQARTQLAAGEPPIELDAVIRKLAAARLVVLAGDDRSGDAQLDLCHEILLTAWPAFAAWVEARRADEQRRRQLQASADQWVARGRGASGLLDDDELAAARAWRRTEAARELGEAAQVTALVEASQAAHDRARSRWRRTVAVVTAGLIAVAAVTTTLAVIARRQAAIAEVERARAEVERRNTEGERKNVVRMLGEQYREVGRQAVASGHAQRAIPYLVAAREQGVDDPDLRALFRVATTTSVAIAVRHDGPVSSASFSADGTRIVTASSDGTARVWDARSGAPVTPPLAHARPVAAAAFSPTGAQILTISVGGTAWLWDAAPSPAPPIALRHAGPIHSAAFSPDGELVVTASDDRTARLWSARTGAPATPPLRHDAAVMSATVNRDGSRVFTTVAEGFSGGLWDVETGAQIARPHAPLSSEPHARGHIALVLGAAFSPDGTRVVTASYDHTARLWDARTGAQLGPALAHDISLSSAAFSPDGARVATVGDDGRVWIRDATTRAAVVPVLVHPAPLHRIAYSCDGTRILAHGADNIVRIWDPASGALVTELELESGASEAVLSPDGSRVVTASADGVTRIWHLRSTAPRVVDATPHAWDAVYSPDGAWIAATDGSGGLRIWVAAGALEPSLKTQLDVGAASVAFEPGGRRFAAIGSDGRAQLGDLTSGTLAGALRAPGTRPEVGGALDKLPARLPARASLSRDGLRIATISTEDSARIWDTDTGTPVTPRLVHGARLQTVELSPDGRHVVTAGHDAMARIWDASSGASIEPPLAHPPGRAVIAVAFSPDSTRIATVSADYNVRLWDAASHRLQATLSGHAGLVTDARFSPDGARLLTRSVDHSARLWDVASGTLAVPPLMHTDWVNDAGFSPDGGRVVTVSGTRAQIWGVRTGRPLGPPLTHPGVLWTAKFSPDGRSVLTAGPGVRIWDAALDTTSLDDWRRLARDNSFPQLGETLGRLAPVR
jgi:WD40 repeat protein